MSDSSIHTPTLRWTTRVGLAALVLIGSAWLMAGPVLLVLQSATVTAVDQDVAGWMHSQSKGLVIGALSAVSQLHGTTGILSLCVVSAATLWVRRRRALMPCLLLTVPGGLLLNIAVKLAVQRARPTWEYAAQTLTSFSFPSGHTLGATVFYGFLVVLFWPGSTRATRVALVTLAVVMVPLVAASRIALGVHYFSDCVAAVVEGLVWLMVCTWKYPSWALDRPGSKEQPA